MVDKNSLGKFFDIDEFREKITSLLTKKDLESSRGEKFERFIEAWEVDNSMLRIDF